MKNLILILLFLSALAACNSSKDEKKEPADISQDPVYQKGLALVTANKCFQCHQIEGTLTGPGYREIAIKYTGASDAVVTDLAKKIIGGSNGVWGEIFMTPHPNVTEEDAKAMVKYVLLLKK